MGDLVRRRLVNQHLAAQRLTKPAEIVHALGAVQAQDYAAARWSIGQRLAGATSADIDRALDDGSIVRTHILRPTWHFVAPIDIRWMLELTSPRVKATCAYQWRKFSLDDKSFRRSNSAIEKALRGGKQLMRSELATALSRAKLDVTPAEIVGHYLMRAELDGLICSGARRGKQFASYWFVESGAKASRRLTAHLLANYDEYVVGIADRTAMTARLERGHDAKALVFENVVLVDGQVVGTWERASGDYELIARLEPREKTAVERAVRRYREFAG